MLPGIEVTPASQEPYSALPPSVNKSFEADIESLWRPYNLPHHNLLETLQIHIPVASGDGYFRLRITPQDRPKETVCTSLWLKGMLICMQLAASPVFRVGSTTWASASPRGATIASLVPELLIKTTFSTVNAASEQSCSLYSFAC